MDIDSKPRANPTVNEHLNSEASIRSDCEKKADAASGGQMKTSTNEVFQSQNRLKRKKTESDCDPGME